MMRLLFVITGLSVGGAQMALFRLVSNLERRFECHIVSLSSIGELGPKFKKIGVTVTSLGMEPNRPNLGAFLKLVELIESWRPHIVHTWLYHADLVGSLAARWARTDADVVWCIRSSALSKSETSVSTRLVVRACAWLSRWLPTRIVSCSTNAMQIHVENGYAREKFVTIPNGIDSRAFFRHEEGRAAIRHELDFVPGNFVVGMFARAHPMKNHRGLLAAASPLLKAHPEARFVLAGEGVDPTNTDLVNAIGAGGLENSVRLLGPREDMPLLMSAMDVLVSASLWGEAFPNVIAEGMACGTPVIATDVGDSAYIVGDTGTIVPPGDEGAMVGALMAFSEMPRTELDALGRLACQRIREHFDISSMCNSYAALYDEIGQGAHSHGTESKP